MGKQVTVMNGYDYVSLPSATRPDKSFKGGQTTVLTDAEYAALPSYVSNKLTGVTNVAEPSRPSKDSNAINSVNTVNSATGSVTLKSGWNVLKLTGNVTIVFPTGATVGSVLACDIMLTQDGTGSRTLTLPSSAKAPGGTAPVLSTGANKVDFLRYVTTDGGVTWALINKQLDIR